MVDETLWDLSEEPGGNCPVQWEGVVAGNHAYFRARGEGWTLAIDPDPHKTYGHDAMFMVEGVYSDDPYAAGWMTVEEAKGFIVGGILTFLGEDKHG